MDISGNFVKILITRRIQLSIIIKTNFKPQKRKKTHQPYTDIFILKSLFQIAMSTTEH